MNYNVDVSRGSLHWLKFKIFAKGCSPNLLELECSSILPSVRNLSQGEVSLFQVVIKALYFPEIPTTDATIMAVEPQLLALFPNRYYDPWRLTFAD